MSAKRILPASGITTPGSVETVSKKLETSDDHTERGVRIDPFQYNRIGLRQTCDQIILAIESGAELKVNGLAFGVGAMDCELQAVGLVCLAN